jgi:hypothetical protein
MSRPPAPGSSSGSFFVTPTTLLRWHHANGDGRLISADVGGYSRVWDLRLNGLLLRGCSIVNCPFTKAGGSRVPGGRGHAAVRLTGIHQAGSSRSCRRTMPNHSPRSARSARSALAATFRAVARSGAARNWFLKVQRTAAPRA